MMELGSIRPQSDIKNYFGDLYNLQVISNFRAYAIDLTSFGIYLLNQSIHRTIILRYQFLALKKLVKNGEWTNEAILDTLVIVAWVKYQFTRKNAKNSQSFTEPIPE